MIDPRTEQGARLAAGEVAARTEIKRCFALVEDRFDLDHPATRAWCDAISRWHLALGRVYPEDFWLEIAALKQTRHRDVATGEWAWSRAPAASVETAIRFLEADLVCFRSGYVKERLIRHLTRQPLGGDGLRRLGRVVLMVLQGPGRREFRAYCRLAIRICDDELMTRIATLAAGDDPTAVRHAGWMRDEILKGWYDGRARQRRPANG